MELSAKEKVANRRKLNAFINKCPECGKKGEVIYFHSDWGDTKCDAILKCRDWPCDGRWSISTRK